MIKYFVMFTAETHCNTVSSSSTTSEGKEAEKLEGRTLASEREYCKKKEMLNRSLTNVLQSEKNIWGKSLEQMKGKHRLEH